MKVLLISFKNNCTLNGLDSIVESSKKDAFILLYERHFDFIHLDPFGSTAPFLDSTFKNATDLVGLTSTDMTALCGVYPNVSLRNYGVKSNRNVEYFRELGARIVITAAIRAAAKSNKGIEVLSTISREHYIHVLLRIIRGKQKADLTLENIKPLFHCFSCGERKFTTLECLCTDKKIDYIGEIWSGPIQNKTFLNRAIKEAGDEFVETVKILKAISGEMETPFYYNLHKLGKEELPKIGDVIARLSTAGYSASRTHFEQTAIKTTAPLSVLQSILS